mmetsp:Transcript_92414/g.214758  ORF Transcript_92414/g.214758 Transcript_92414/m.214758 type:complete len:222 (-) Transcript_92414:25-690(-)
MPLLHCAGSAPPPRPSACRAPAAPLQKSPAHRAPPHQPFAAKLHHPRQASLQDRGTGARPRPHVGRPPGHPQPVPTVSSPHRPEPRRNHNARHRKSHIALGAAARACVRRCSATAPCPRPASRCGAGQCSHVLALPALECAPPPARSSHCSPAATAEATAPAQRKQSRCRYQRRGFAVALMPAVWQATAGGRVRARVARRSVRQSRGRWQHRSKQPRWCEE